MKYIDEYRDPIAAQQLIAQIRALVEQQGNSEPVRLMEFCGGHTHAIFRFGLREMLEGCVDLRSGPGCPVCVTAAVDLDYAIALAQVPDLILTTFGDMMRVPGGDGTLQDARAIGADVRMVYSPLDALAIARKNPHRQVVFLGVGFETTAPGVAATILQAEKEALVNFSVLSLHKLTPPAMRAILDAGEVALDGIIGPGHVSAIIGSSAWLFLPQVYHMPCAVSGFEPLDLLQAIYALVKATVTRLPDVFNTYGRSVQPEGNLIAQKMMEQVFTTGPAVWRGFGSIPASGLHVRESLAHRDAALLYPLDVPARAESPGCRCGEVLRGVIAPPECKLFQRVCNPRNPIGPCMVSAEGACAAYYKYQDAV
ncbi:MAG: hydrogenase formation protein HypD [Anaerolineales bacterium]|nr:MAG: hydrogenase formation protein HypD [Anaerolineales bacterium]